MAQELEKNSEVLALISELMYRVDAGFEDIHRRVLEVDKKINELWSELKAAQTMIHIEDGKREIDYTMKFQVIEKKLRKIEIELNNKK